MKGYNLISKIGKIEQIYYVGIFFLLQWICFAPTIGIYKIIKQ